MVHSTSTPASVVPGGVGGIEIIRIEINAAGGYPGLVDAGELADHLCGHAVAVQSLIAQVCADLYRGLADDSGAVSPESDGMIAAVGAAQLSFGDDNADGQAIAHIIEVTVDAGHHPVSPDSPESWRAEETVFREVSTLP